CARFYNALDSW
nr:immunoglobulin heavy chain junction region [Macaca mulatta]MOV36100.1 immunoglobulin heavy chain junction region [Macaca mulatta]